MRRPWWAIRPGMTSKSKSAEQHRVHQREHFRARPSPRRAIAQRDRLVHERLQPEPITERRGEQHPGIRDDPLIVEDHFRRPPRPAESVTIKVTS
jgi:hypothetical protein